MCKSTIQEGESLCENNSEHRVGTTWNNHGNQPPGQGELIYVDLTAGYIIPDGEDIRYVRNQGRFPIPLRVAQKPRGGLRCVVPGPSAERSLPGPLSPPGTGAGSGRTAMLTLPAATLPTMLYQFCQVQISFSLSHSFGLCLDSWISRRNQRKHETLILLLEEL